MKIVTRQQFSGHWTAVDDSTYDGPGCPIGAGPTEAAAIADLMEQIEEKAREVTEARVAGASMRVFSQPAFPRLPTPGSAPPFAFGWSAIISPSRRSARRRRSVARSISSDAACEDARDWVRVPW